MSDWPITIVEPLITITPWSMESLGQALAAGGGTAYPGASTVYPVANTAYFIPFILTKPFTSVKMAQLNGGTVSGNIDVGIYDDKGTRLVSIGSTAQSGINNWQSFDITDILLGPGKFFLAVAMDNTTATLFRGTVTNAAFLSCLGQREMASAFPLPATVTFATMVSAYIPAVLLTGRTLI